MSATDAMIAEGVAIAERIVRRRLPAHHVAHDDMLSDALFGVVYASDNWHDGRGLWRQYVTYRVKMQILNGQRTRNGKTGEKMTDSLDEVEALDHLPALAFNDNTDSSDALDAERTLAALVDSCSTLTRAERASLTADQGNTRRERNTISHARQRAIARLAQHVEAAA